MPLFAERPQSWCRIKLHPARSPAAGLEGTKEWRVRHELPRTVFREHDPKLGQTPEGGGRDYRFVMNCSPDLVARVRSHLNRSGYCFFGVDEIERLLGGESKRRNGKGHETLQEFAKICGAKVETTPHLKSARFTPTRTAGAEVDPGENPFSLDVLLQTPLQA